MPANDVRARMPRFITVDAIIEAKKRWRVSAMAMAYRLHALGLLTQGNEGLIPYAIRMIKRKQIDFHVAADFKKTFSRECKPRCV